MPRKTRKQRQKTNERRQRNFKKNYYLEEVVKREFTFDIPRVAAKINRKKQTDKSSYSNGVGTKPRGLFLSLTIGILLIGLELMVYWAQKQEIINLP